MILGKKTMRINLYARVATDVVGVKNIETKM